jgi:hypothetical protein
VFADGSGKLLQNGVKLEADLVTGPASSTNNHLALFNLTSGKELKQAAFAVGDVARLSASQTFAGTNTFSSPIGAADGAESTPSVTFAADLDTGMWRPAANTVAFSTNGAERWRITSGGIFEAPGAQTIRTATGALTLATAAGNGNIIFSPHGTGKVGIGTTSPGRLLTVNGEVSINNRVFSSIVNIWNGGSGRTFTITGGSNGNTIAFTFTALNKNGIIQQAYHLIRNPSFWLINGPTSVSNGTAPTVTVSGDGTTTVTVNVLGAGAAPESFNGGFLFYEFQQVGGSIVVS